MLRSLEPFPSLGGLLELLMALILLSVLIALLQSDATVGAVRRAVNNIAALPLLLIVDLLSSIEMVLTSGRAQSVFAIIQETIFGIVGYLRKTIENANVCARTHKVFLTVYQTTLEYVDAAQLLAGRIKRLFAIAQALLSIVCEAGTNYMGAVRTGGSISEDVLSICNFIFHASIRIISLLYVVSRSLYNLMSAIMINIQRNLKKSAVYDSFTNLLLSIPGGVSHKLHSFWTNICTGLNQKLTAALELIFGDGHAIESLSLGSSTHMLSSSRDVTPASNSIYQSPWKGRLRARTSGADKH
ncbi:hypothetical protein KCU73_g2902, partial [Aureobasidium melanogenum]